MLDEANFKSAVVVSNKINDTVAVITAGVLFDFYVKYYLTSSDYVNGIHAAIEPFDEFCQAYSAAYSMVA